jgi:hypothetical protein
LYSSTSRDKKRKANISLHIGNFPDFEIKEKLKARRGDLTTAIPAFKRLTSEDGEFEPNLGSIVSSRQEAWAI